MSGNWQHGMPTPDAYWIDRVLYDVHHQPDDLARYLQSADAYLKDIPLPDTLKAAIRDNQIGDLYLAGANPYLLRAHCLGLRMPEADFLRSLRAVAKEPHHG
jgi:protocatechuate 4,5-dioxygenase alpha chain